MTWVGIVGGGPAGLTTACLLKNVDAIVLEEHKRIGHPPHCTGLVGLRTLLFYTRLVGDRIIQNSYNMIWFHTPAGSFRIVSKKPLAYKIDRVLLEELLFEKADSIHKVVLGVRVKDIVSNKIMTVSGDYRVDRIVLAEGAARTFSKKIFGGRVIYVTGVQWWVRAKDVERHEFHTFFLRSNPYSFIWLVPVNEEECLIGMGFRYSKAPPLDKIVRYVGGRLKIRIKVLDPRPFGGLIPIGLPCKGVMGRVYAIGDSLPASKPFTGGGLYAISVLAPALARELEQGTRIYIKRLNELRSRLAKQYTLYKMLAGTIGCWLAPSIIGLFCEAGIRITPRDYDEHERILKKALANVHRILLRKDTLFKSLGILRTVLETLLHI